MVTAFAILSDDISKNHGIFDDDVEGALADSDAAFSIMEQKFIQYTPFDHILPRGMERDKEEVKPMTEKEKSAAKTFEKVLSSMTPDEKDKLLVFMEGMAFKSELQMQQAANQ